MNSHAYTYRCVAVRVSMSRSLPVALSLCTAVCASLSRTRSSQRVARAVASVAPFAQRFGERRMISQDPCGFVGRSWPKPAIGSQAVHELMKCRSNGVPYGHKLHHQLKSPSPGGKGAARTQRVDQPSVGEHTCRLRTSLTPSPPHDVWKRWVLGSR